MNEGKNPVVERLTADHPDAKSADLKLANIRKLRDLFPEAFAEGKVDFAVLMQLLGGAVEERDERYGLNWHGKRAARQLALLPSTGTLRPAQEESVDWERTQNLFIEGDNLEVLKLLQKSYSQRVKIIYIDPPYNTGKDFVYPDDFRDGIRNYLELTGQLEGGRAISSNTEARGRFHTDWLNMMYPRIKLARTLLRDDGVIFISIDDSEVDRLRAICDELFGEENFVAQVAWQGLDTIKNDAQYFSENHEYVVCYAKRREMLDLRGIPKTEKQRAYYSNRDDDPRGDYLLTPLHAKSGSESALYSFTFRNGQVWAPPPGTYARYSRETLSELDRDGRIYLDPEGRTVPQKKTFWSEVGSRMPAPTFWDYESFGSTRQSNRELAELMGKGVFQNPKPTKLIAALLDIVQEDDGLVLDFFAGSGTTGHSVWKLNARATSGQKTFILVQMPEPLDPANRNQATAVEFARANGLRPNIAELTKERLRRAAKSIRAEHPEYVGDLGFRVFKLDYSNIEAWRPNAGELEQTLFSHQEHLKADRSEDDILYELLLKRGLDLCMPIDTKTMAKKKVHSIGAGVLIACLAPSILRADAEDLAAGIVKWHGELKPAGDTVCVFRDSAFEDDVTKTNLAAILNQHGIEHVRSL